MGTVLRYACLLCLGLASIFTYVNVSAITWQRLASTSGYAIQDPADRGFIVLALICVLGLLSIVNSIVRGFPSMIRNWYDRRRGQINTMMMGGLICFVFLVT